jgi:hypothetical protein
MIPDWEPHIVGRGAWKFPVSAIVAVLVISLVVWALSS